MLSVIRFLLFFGIILGCSGCHRSGTWENDSANWERAFGAPPPKEIEVVHSLYWRSPHFTREEAWTFHIKAPESFHKNWLAAYKVKHPSANDWSKLDYLKKDKPSWFLPKPFSEYEIWVLANDPDARFAMFIDRSTGEFFVTDE